MNNLIIASTRPAKIATLCLAILLAVGLSAEAPAALPVNPQDTLRSFYDTLLTTMKDGRTLGQSGRYVRLAPVVGRLFDVPSMARLAIGPSWSTLSPTQQQQVTDAYGHYISATYADRFELFGRAAVGHRRAALWHGGDRTNQDRQVKGRFGEPQLSDAGKRGLLANRRRLPRRLDQPAGDATLGISFDPSAGGRRRADHGIEPQGRLTDPKPGRGVMTHI